MRTAIVFICLCVLFTGCDMSMSNEIGEPRSSQTVLDIQGKLDDRKSSPFRVEELRFDSLAASKSIFFLDENHGWLGGKELFKTQDGGKTWQLVMDLSASGGHIDQILFLNNLVGLLVVTKNSGVAFNSAEASIMQTADGGQTWSVPYREAAVDITRLSFFDDQSGWLVGIKYDASDALTYAPLVLRTSDQGRNWIGVSTDSIRLASSETQTSGEPVNVGIMGIAINGPLAVHVITSRMKVYQTTNGGREWKETANLKQGLIRTGIMGFGVSNQRLWEVGAIDSTEGIGAHLAVQSDVKSWVRYGVGKVFFSDAVALSDGEFVACGYIKTESTSGRNPRAPREAAVFYSDNGGSSWSLAFRSAKVERIHKLTSVNSKQIWAVGDGGLVLRLDR